MFPALTGLCGVLFTSLVALVVDSRRRQDMADADVWRAIDSLRDRLSENNETLAEIRGLLAGLWQEVLDDPEVWRQHRKRTDEYRTRQRSVDKE